MKCLFLVHPEQDYLEFFLFNGLCEVLNKENVILYPMKLSYTGLSDLWYKLPNENKLGVSHSTPYMVPKTMRLYLFEEICEMMSEFDFIVLSSPRYYAVHALSFIKKIFGKIPKPVVFVDGEDSEGLRFDIINEFKPIAIFKRELIHPIENVFPLPFSSCLPYLPFWDEIKDKEKTLNVFALFGNTYHLRTEIVKSLLEYNLQNSCIGIDNGLVSMDLNLWNETRKIAPLKPYKGYLETMASAKINIIIRGHGRDTVRYWEAASFKTLMLIKDPGIIIPHPYEDKKHCVYFSDTNDLKEKIDYYLSHEEERQEIANNCFEHTMAFHTNSRRAEQFLSIIKEKM